MTIFLSYSWANEDAANKLDLVFQSIGIKVLRDKREVGYNKSLKEYMQSIRDSDYAFILISDEYLKSPACMYEINELMKDQNYLNKILPLVLPSAKIYKPEDHITYISHWKSRVESFKDEISKIDPAQSVSLIKKLKEYEEIYLNIGEFLLILSERNIPLFSSLESNGFRDIINYLEIKDDLQDQIIMITSGSLSPELMEIEINKLEISYPYRYETYIAKGHVASIDTKYQKAIVAYEKAAELKPDFGPIYYNLGCMLQKVNQFDLAEKAYIKAYNLSPENSKILNNLAIVQKELGNSEAENTFKKAIQVNPADENTYFNFANYLVGVYKNIEARQMFLKCLSLNPKNIHCLLSFSRYLFNSEKDANTSITYLKIVLEIERYNSDAHLLIAEIYEQQGEIIEARKHFEIFLTIERSNIKEHENYFLFLYRNYPEEEQVMLELLNYINILKDQNS